MMMRWLPALALLGALVAGCGERAAAVKASAMVSDGPWLGLPLNVRDSLARGVNAANWFTHRGDPRLAPGWPEAADFAQMRKLGLRHTRVLFDPQWLQMNAAHPRFFDTGIRQALDAGLLVILAMQPPAEHKLRMLKDDAAVEELAAQWKQVAAAFAQVPVDRLVFEVLNEPEIEDVSRAMAVQERLIAAVREVTPGRVIAVGGAHFSDIADLSALTPLSLPGVIYSFHFYEPHNFTHQGATWGWPMWMVLRDMPYPSSETALAPVLPTLTPIARTHADWYGKQGWNKAKLAEFVDQAAAWSKQHRVPVWCSEFGVLRDSAPAASRRAWLTDTRSLFESSGIAWTYFDWWGHFGLVSGAPEARVIDEDARVGLGLEQ